MFYQDWMFRTVRVHRLNDKGQMPQSHVFDIIRRPDRREALLMETWGGFNKGYAKCFPNEAEMLVYLGKRLNKIVRPADATIGLGTLKDDQTRITMDQGHIRMVMSEEDWEAQELLMDAMFKRGVVSRAQIQAFGEVIGYEDDSWHSNINLDYVLENASEVKPNKVLPEVTAAMIYRVGSAHLTPPEKMADSLVAIQSFMAKPEDMRSMEEEKQFSGNFNKAFIATANMMRKHTRLPVEEGPKAASREV